MTSPAAYALLVCCQATVAPGLMMPSASLPPASLPRQLLYVWDRRWTGPDPNDVSGRFPPPPSPPSL